ncbi:hypothetical protein KIF24_03290 [Micromonospora sp. Llam7]|uniref:hypothetical protein n=1 Tax=Micromonospora tarapacensis TaxID=2835305 RepID=UPI001C83A08F|nr:hypothetical protein [Micromonospora tarapacensis]MBX7265171.1 hypothetical protein [Micromonospora tarapacensis]
MVPWLAPPLIPTARALTGAFSGLTALSSTGWAVAGATVPLAGYARARGRRA